MFPGSLMKVLWERKFHDSVGQDLLHIVQDYVPGLTVASMLRLELSDMEMETELVVVTFISAILLEIWSSRMMKTKLRRSIIRTNLEARCQILRKTRLNFNHEAFSNMINNL